jgi:hypothetical protein
MWAVQRLDCDVGCAISLNIEALGARFEPVGGGGRTKVVKKLDIITDVVCGSVVEHPAVPNRIGDGGEGD